MILDCTIALIIIIFAYIHACTLYECMHACTLYECMYACTLYECMHACTCSSHRAVIEDIVANK